MTPPCRASWRNPRLVCTLLLVFLCGAAVGMLGMSLVGRRGVYAQQASWREGNKEITLARLKRELDLSEEQAKQLEAVLDDFFKYYHTLQNQLDEVRAAGKSRILRLLNPEQRRKFEHMLSELQTGQLR